MKRSILLVCLFAVFSFAFASDGSFGDSGKDVKQENVQLFNAQPEVDVVSNLFADEKEAFIVSPFVNYESSTILISETKKTLPLPDILVQSYSKNEIKYKSSDKNLIVHSLPENAVSKPDIIRSLQRFRDSLNS